MGKTNLDVSSILRQISFLLRMNYDKNDSDRLLTFKIRSYDKAADVIENLPESLESIYATEGIEGLQSIPSIGKGIASKIEEYLKTGEIKYYNQLRLRIPVKVSEFLELEGIGPKTIKILYDKLKIHSINDLENAAINGKIRNIPGFSNRKEEIILKKIRQLKEGHRRYLIGDLYPIVKKIEQKLITFDEVKKAVVAGSFRRMKETIGDVDFLVVSDEPIKVIDFFTNLAEVEEILTKGLTKVSVKLNIGIKADLLIVPSKSFGTALLYFTGSKEHDIALRKIAISKGMRLNEWNLYVPKTHEKIMCLTEEEVYHKLGLIWIPPEIRENTGEIELAKVTNHDIEENNRLPKLIDYEDLRGDLQVHSNNTDGQMSIEEMAFYAKEKFGLEYIAISDHTISLRIARGLDEVQLISQANKIEEINDKIKNGYDFSQEITSKIIQFADHSENMFGKGSFRIFSSAEVNIQKDGSLDISDNVLEKLDVVGAAIHSNFSLPIDVQTNRLIKAAQNPNIDIIYHPTGRIINRREGYPIDIEKLINAALDTNTVLEVDAHYNRLDLKAEYIRMAVENDVKLVIDSDAHHPLHYTFLIFGIGQARRGWATKKNILNTASAENFLKNLK